MPAFQRAAGCGVHRRSDRFRQDVDHLRRAVARSTRATKSIVSVEDPVEFRLDGIKQIQINPRAGVTFPTALPSVLRADPDIVFIGEVRDTETARIAADASITGHLVLSTLHTNARRGRADASHRHGRRAVPRRVGAHARRLATARPPAVRALRRARRRAPTSSSCASSAPTMPCSKARPCVARSGARPAATPATAAGCRSSRSCP